MIQIDTGERFIETRARSSSVDEGQIIKIANRTRAATEYRKVKANIEAQECPGQLDTYWHRESLMLDALHLFDAHVAADLFDTYQKHRAALIHGGAYQSAQAVPHRTASGIPNAQNGNDDKGTDDEFQF